LLAIQVDGHLVGNPTARPVVIPAVQWGVGQKVKMAFIGHLLPRSLPIRAVVRIPACPRTRRPPGGSNDRIIIRTSEWIQASAQVSCQFGIRPGRSTYR